jgi:hypothetical protein
MKDLISYSELESYFDNEAFILKTQQQISKDFAKYNLNFDSNFENTVYTKGQIELQIADNLVELMKEGETRLLQLLYTIDVSEKEFLSITIDPNFIQLLAEKILFREAYKIFLRTKFSSPSNSIE